MAKTKKQVTLNDETITALEQEGLGSLSTGIEIMFRDWKRGITPSAKPAHIPKDKTLDLPDDDHPKVDGRVLAGERVRAINEAKAEQADQARRRKSQLYNLREFGPELAGDRLPGISDEDWTEAQTAWDISQAEHKAQQKADELWRAKRDKYIAGGMAPNDAGKQADIDMGMAQLQTLKLSPAALKALHMDATPPDMPDEVIADANASYVAPKREPTLSELWEANPLEVPEDDA